MGTITASVCRHVKLHVLVCLIKLHAYVSRILYAIHLLTLPDFLLYFNVTSNPY